MEKYLESLNPEQLAAVSATEGYVRVIAGAGTGKTRVLTARYLHLLEDNLIDPDSLLCVTFTKKAASEMVARIRRFEGEDFSSQFICTYHSLCTKILRAEHDAIMYPKNFEVMDERQQRALLRNLYRKYDLRMDSGSFGAFLAWLGKFKSNIDYVPGMLSSLNADVEKREALKNVQDKVFIDYIQYQKDHRILDFDDLICFTLYLMTTDEKVRRKWQEKFDYIEVDEFQDTSGLEEQLIDILAAKKHNLFVVGDPDQNIYEWRGSDNRILLDFPLKHRPTQDFILARNYRSTDRILKCANSLISHNSERVKKDLYTDRRSDVPVYFYCEKTLEKCAADIAAIIGDKVKKGGKFSDDAVLLRSGFLSDEVEQAFKAQDIPYEVIGGVPFNQREEIKDALAILKVVDCDDDASLKRIINIPRRGFGEKKLKYLENLAGGKNLYHVLRSSLNDAVIGKSSVRDLVSAIEKVKRMIGRYSLSDIIDAALDETGYSEYIRKLGDDEKFDNLNTFRKSFSRYAENNSEISSLHEYIEDFEQVDAGEMASDKVKLLTIHAAKGLEFKNVFVTGFSEGIFPSNRSNEEGRGGMEEERRLCYVALTRAQDELYLFGSAESFGGDKRGRVSRFIDEIGTDNLCCIGYETANRANNLLPGPTFVVGLAIVHPAYGRGVITEVNPDSVGVDFGSFGCKHLKISSRLAEMIEQENPTKDNKDVLDIKPVKNNVKDRDSSDSSIGDIPFYKPWIQDPNHPETRPEYDPQGAASRGRVREGKGASIRSGRVFDMNTIPCALNLDYLKSFNYENVNPDGWECVGIIDHGTCDFHCQNCGTMIRYVHNMVSKVGRTLSVGCLCAGNLMGDIELSKRQETLFKKGQKLMSAFRSAVWRPIAGAGYALDFAGEHFEVFSPEEGKFQMSINHGAFRRFSSLSSVKQACFDRILDRSLRNK